METPALIESIPTKSQKEAARIIMLGSEIPNRGPNANKLSYSIRLLVTSLESFVVKILSQPIVQFAQCALEIK